VARIGSRVIGSWIPIEGRGEADVEPSASPLPPGKVRARPWSRSGEATVCHWTRGEQSRGFNGKVRSAWACHPRRGWLRGGTGRQWWSAAALPEEVEVPVLPGRGRPQKNLALARPTGVGRGITTYGEVPIEGREEWDAAAARRLA
jgi:hypothetical protein